jgi:hypothetical protein
MSIAEQWVKEGTISWIPVVVFFLLAAGFYAWGKQWHMATYVALIVVLGLGVMELICKMQTGKTMSQWEVIWSGQSVRDYILSWCGHASLLMAIYCLGHHFK